jgi:hypothetical protein
MKSKTEIEIAKICTKDNSFYLDETGKLKLGKLIIEPKGKDILITYNLKNLSEKERKK